MGHQRRSRGTHATVVLAESHADAGRFANNCYPAATLPLLGRIGGYVSQPVEEPEWQGDFRIAPRVAATALSVRVPRHRARLTPCAGHTLSPRWQLGGLPRTTSRRWCATTPTSRQASLCARPYYDKGRCRANVRDLPRYLDHPLPGSILLPARGQQPFRGPLVRGYQVAADPATPSRCGAPGCAV